MLSLIHANVVHMHFSGEFGCPVRIAEEPAANGEIEQDVEFLIKWRGEFAAVGFPFGLSLCQLCLLYTSRCV